MAVSPVWAQADVAIMTFWLLAQGILLMTICSFTTHSRSSTCLCWVVLTVSLGFAHIEPLQAGWLDAIKDTFKKEEKVQLVSKENIAAGLREALKVATKTTTAQLGQTDGFNLDPLVHIPLPDQLAPVRDMLEKFGMESMLSDLELRLNRAAEIAAPKAADLFLQAIEDMTMDDVMAIYKGPDDAATSYFRSSMSEPLAAEMRPLIDDSLSQVEAVGLYEQVMQRYNQVPFVPPVETDLSEYVLELGMDGIFTYLAKEEAAIRHDPAKRTTEILRQVFGG